LLNLQTVFQVYIKNHSVTLAKRRRPTDGPFQYSDVIQIVTADPCYLTDIPFQHSTVTWVTFLTAFVIWSEDRTCSHERQTDRQTSDSNTLGIVIVGHLKTIDIYNYARYLD